MLADAVAIIGTMVRVHSSPVECGFNLCDSGSGFRVRGSALSRMWWFIHCPTARSIDKGVGYNIAHIE